jgi:hypothetical protein
MPGENSHGRIDRTLPTLESSYIITQKPGKKTIATKIPAYSGYHRSCSRKIHSYDTCSPQSLIAIIVIKSPIMNPSAQITASRNGGKQKQSIR